MKRLFIALTAATALAFAACGKKDDGPPQIATVPGAGLTGPGVNPASCQVGQVYSQSYGCLNQGTCSAGYGWVPSISQCAQGTPVTVQTIYGYSVSSGRFFGTMSVVNSAQFALLLKYANLCDPYWVGYNFGSWNCDNWAYSGFMQLQYFAGSTAANTNATLFIGAGSGYGANYSYGQIGGAYIGFSQQARISNANNSNGMYIDGIGPGGVSVAIKLVANNGNIVTTPTLNSFTAEAYYQNVLFATVNFSRY